MKITDIQFAEARLARAKATARVITDWDEAQSCAVGTIGVDPWDDMIQKCGREDWREQGAGIDQSQDGPLFPLVVVYEPAEDQQ